MHKNDWTNLLILRGIAPFDVFVLGNIMSTKVDVVIRTCPCFRGIGSCYRCAHKSNSIAELFNAILHNAGHFKLMPRPLTACSHTISTRLSRWMTSS